MAKSKLKEGDVSDLRKAEIEKFLVHVHAHLKTFCHLLDKDMSVATYILDMFNYYKAYRKTENGKVFLGYVAAEKDESWDMGFVAKFYYFYWLQEEKEDGIENPECQKYSNHTFYRKKREIVKAYRRCCVAVYLESDLTQPIKVKDVDDRLREYWTKTYLTRGTQKQPSYTSLNRFFLEQKKSLTELDSKIDYLDQIEFPQPDYEADPLDARIIMPKKALQNIMEDIAKATAESNNDEEVSEESDDDDDNNPEGGADKDSKNQGGAKTDVKEADKGDAKQKQQQPTDNEDDPETVVEKKETTLWDYRKSLGDTISREPGTTIFLRYKEDEIVTVYMMECGNVSGFLFDEEIVRGCHCARGFDSTDSLLLDEDVRETKAGINAELYPLNTATTVDLCGVVIWRCFQQPFRHILKTITADPNDILESILQLKNSTNRPQQGIKSWDRKFIKVTIAPKRGYWKDKNMVLLPKVLSVGHGLQKLVDEYLSRWPGTKRLVNKHQNNVVPGRWVKEYAKSKEDSLFQPNEGWRYEYFHIHVVVLGEEDSDDMDDDSCMFPIPPNPTGKKTVRVPRAAKLDMPREQMSSFFFAAPGMTHDDLMETKPMPEPKWNKENPASTLCPSISVSVRREGYLYQMIFSLSNIE